MATETPCTPNYHKSKDFDEELSRSDVSVEKSRGDENAVFKMTPSSTRKRTRRISSDDEDEVDRKTSITESVEDETISSSPEILRSSSKKKTLAVYSSGSEDGTEESRGVTPGFNALKGCGTAVRRVKKNLDEAFGKNEVEDDILHRNTKITDSDSEGNSSSNESDSDNNGTVHSSLQKRRSARKSTRGNVWPPEGNNCTASTKKAKKEKALEALRKNRERRAGGLSGKTYVNNDYNDEGFVSPKSFMEEEEVEEEEAEESGSDMDDFVVEDSQSQELPVFAKLELDEAYKRLVQISLSSILDNNFMLSLQEERDPYFDEAEATIEKVIESKKNLVASTTWKEFKKMLERCSVLKSQVIRRKRYQKHNHVVTTCEACRRTPRNLTERIIFSSGDCNGVKELPLKMEFDVGCYCAERGSLYHDLHHHKSQLRESCIDKINKVREALRTESDKNIVEYCIKDEEWLNVLFKTFKALLTEANGWAEDGEKTKNMKADCARFH